MLGIQLIKYCRNVRSTFASILNAEVLEVKKCGKRNLCHPLPECSFVLEKNEPQLLPNVDTKAFYKDFLPLLSANCLGCLHHANRNVLILLHE